VFDQNKVHYVRNQYDIGFAVSVTDEILALEPVEEKLQQLEKKYRMRTLDIIRLMKERLNFYALYNLFDQVVMNKIDFYSQQQKIWIHMKNFES
jgi:hypothetical protein